MAPLLFKELKASNFSCASPASAAVCSSIDRKSIIRSTIITRSSVDRPRRTNPSKPKPYSQNSRKSLDRIPSTRTRTSTSTKSDLISPASSSRFLLDEASFSDVYPEAKQSSTSALALEIFEKPKPLALTSPRLLKPMKENESSKAFVRPSISSDIRKDQALIDSPRVLQDLKADKLSSDARKASSSPGSHHDQVVVVLKVSLHCKGCEGKVRKHISKMEGVRSFNIDFAAKKVTVMGDVTPLGVLNSVSKVKNAQFWQSAPRSSVS